MVIPILNPRQWESVVFPEHPQHDTIWTITMGHDAQVYIGLCLEGRGGGVAQLYMYDTKARRLQHLADIGRVTGEPPDSGHATQGKIHFSLCHARDGKVYGATHCTTPPIGVPIWSPFTMWGDPVMSFPGAHIFRYDTKSREAVDFGVITPHEGIPYLMLDEKRKCLYGATYPKAHFFRTDLAGRDFKDYGRISSMYPIAMIFDSTGNLYTSDVTSRLIKYDVKQDRLRFFDTRPYVEPWNQSGACSWITDMCQGPDGFIYGLTYSNDHLFRFDPRRDEPAIEDLGPGLDDIPAVFLRCMTADHSGHIYYTVNQKRNQSDGNILARYHVATGKKEVIGLMELNGQGNFPWRVVCDPAGTLYFACVQRIPVNILIYRPE
ncbi:MAG: hypothetical protein KJ964_03770 [Verrucomicrobia bacterium]|nr:hypothetical protein [Verrucomicrobiota bacterium]MBU1734897.1 hypothetical protein [Verrucomicrobiota bacterium]MBU1857691.1 hypothetical protein [Verrucomicrobiota bacterium]